MKKFYFPKIKFREYGMEITTSFPAASVAYGNLLQQMQDRLAKQMQKSLDMEMMDIMPGMWVHRVRWMSWGGK